MSHGSPANSWGEAAVPRDDHKECKNICTFLSVLAQEVLQFRGNCARRQGYKATFPRFELPEDYQSKAFHLYDADEIGRRLEPNSIQLGRLHS